MRYFVTIKKGGAGGGPYIGPRGGKWADPQHTIPWEAAKPVHPKTAERLRELAGTHDRASTEPVASDAAKLRSKENAHVLRMVADGHHGAEEVAIATATKVHGAGFTDAQYRAIKTNAENAVGYTKEWDKKNRKLHGEPAASDDHGHGDKKLSPDEEAARAHRKKLLESTPTPKTLPEDQDNYFLKPAGSVEVDVSKLTPIRARAEGIENAAKYMELARQGHIPKRKPISLKDNGDGTYTVLDGNSTYAIANKYGWTKIRGVVEKA